MYKFVQNDIVNQFPGELHQEITESNNLMARATTPARGQFSDFKFLVRIIVQGAQGLYALRQNNLSFIIKRLLADHPGLLLNPLVLVAVWSGYINSDFINTRFYG